MKKLVLIDGTNLVFRSYYATAYTGNFMYTSYNFPTNALYGLTNMINKIVKEEQPDYILAAFDKGKTFRHTKYGDYKAGRSETPEELKQQFPKAKELLAKMGVLWYEHEGFEADDIIGTLARIGEKDPDIIVSIISSDKDFLQLASNQVTIKLVKNGDLVSYTPEKLDEELSLKPDQIRDLKGLEGDKSDNIPGVPGVGQKTALKLLHQFGTIEGIYEEIDQVKGKLKEKLIDNKNSAFFSKEIATIHKEMDLEISLEDTSYDGFDYQELSKLYQELEFRSLLRRLRPSNENTTETSETIGLVSSVDANLFKDGMTLFLEMDGNNYHHGDILGLAIKNQNGYFYIPVDVLLTYPKEIFRGYKGIRTYDVKRTLVGLKRLGFDLPEIDIDLMLAGYLLNMSVKDDVAAMAETFGFELPFEDAVYGKGAKRAIPSNESLLPYVLLKLKFIDKYTPDIKLLIEENNLNELLYELEQPLAYILSDMEFTGISIDTSVLNRLDRTITNEMVEIEKRVYEFAGETFNISSPKQLGVILFEKLGIHYPKRKKNSYSTAVDVLEKIREHHPIVQEILRYRTLSKLKSTYINGLLGVVFDDGKIHTIFNQVIAATGRLSSVEPNIQNIPVRTEIGREIRKAFVPSPGNVLIAADYSQIELRVMAHISSASNLIDAFIHDEDIHTMTAMEIYEVSKEEVTANMRRNAKAVNFGIIYGISGFGLSQNLDIDVKVAQSYIDRYLEKYPGIKEYMDTIIKKCQDQGYVTTLFNRRRYIADINDKNFMKRQFAERMAMNTPIQGSAADIIKKAMIQVAEVMKDKQLKSKMIVQVHDELIFDVESDEVEVMKKLIKETMEQCVDLKVPLKVDLNTGKNWYEAK